MKRTITFLTGLVVALSSFGQVCMPDSQYTERGYYPDSLPPAYVGSMYEQRVTVVVPKDTTVDIGGNPITVDIDSIVLQQITNLPAGFSYDCNPTGCAFPGNSSSCFVISGNPMDNAIARDYKLEGIVKAHGGGFSVDDTANLGTFTIMEDTTSSINKIATTGFKITAISPNPVEENAVVTVYAQKPATLQLELVNILGETVMQRKEPIGTGKNEVKLNLNLPGGLYFLSAQTGQNKHTQKLVISK